MNFMLTQVLLVPKTEETQFFGYLWSLIFELIWLKFKPNSNVHDRISHQPDISCLVKSVASCIYKLCRIEMNKLPENESNFLGCYCYGYWKSDKIFTKFNEKCSLPHSPQDRYVHHECPRCDSTTSCLYSVLN